MIWESEIRCPNGRILTQIRKRDRDIDTSWETKHLFDSAEDLEAYLGLPEREFGGEVDTKRFLDMEQRVGDRGIVMIDTGDPLCAVAGPFEMGMFTIVAMTDQKLFHRALEREARFIHKRVEAVSRALPGRLWRVVGSEYASPPYLPPSLYREYWVTYTEPIIRSIKKYGGYARVHSHGRLRDILDIIAETGCDGLDPIEPPNQGDVELKYVRENYGKQMVLFGNIEATDIENLPAPKFAQKVKRALEEGTSGQGRGFVLMPSACPYGRELSARAMKNYELMIELASGS